MQFVLFCAKLLCTHLYETIKHNYDIILEILER